MSYSLPSTFHIHYSVKVSQPPCAVSIIISIPILQMLHSAQGSTPPAERGGRLLVQPWASTGSLQAPRRRTELMALFFTSLGAWAGFADPGGADARQSVPVGWCGTIILASPDWALGVPLPTVLSLLFQILVGVIVYYFISLITRSEELKYYLGVAVSIKNKLMKKERKQLPWST